MKIDVTEIQLGLITARDSLLKRDLYYDLHTQVYGHAPRKQWQPAKTSATLRILTGTQTDLSHMARELRRSGWSAYYWRDRYGVSDTDDYNSWINYGTREGIIIGRYCANLTAWLLANT